MFHNHASSNGAINLTAAESARRILVVEDDFPIRQFHTHVLSRSGYVVDAVEDGIAGWEALHAHHFDLLITDQHMPRLCGFELVRKVRSAGMLLPVVLVTAPLPEEELERSRSLGLAATLFKPFSPEQLDQTVKQILRRDRLGDSQLRIIEESIT
jgi:DNA-binding response OmpR family regulator